MKPGDIVESRATGNIAEVVRVNGPAILIRYTTGRPKGTTHWVNEAAILPRPDFSGRLPK